MGQPNQKPDRNKYYFVVEIKMETGLGFYACVRKETLERSGEARSLGVLWYGEILYLQ